jgi:UDPglucose 6-dehydrogenase
MTKIGFIGQGFIGRHMADDFAERGYAVVRYALGGEYINNREAIAKCDVVFVAVPTPTTLEGFDGSTVASVLPLVGAGKVAVVKSTVIPGFTRQLQAQFPAITIIHSPEFLREKSAAEDTRKPERTIIGLVEENNTTRKYAESLLEILPKADFELVCTAEEAELIKYGGNVFLTMKVVYMNLLHDLARAVGAEYETVAAGIGADRRIGMSHMGVVDEAGGRGAGGHCFPKDSAALLEIYKARCREDELGTVLLEALIQKNRSLLEQSGKDIALLRQIYGNPPSNKPV